MPKDSIYLISDSGKLEKMEHQLYANEDLLQQLIANHPELLTSDQIDPESPPRWLLLGREAAIPDAAEAGDRWSLDHLLLDQFGVPTLVEVKRSTNPEIRRKVIGQMLDYIANAQAYWLTGRMRQMLADEAGSSEAADARMTKHLALDDEPEIMAQHIERFWQQVEINLREGNVRLLFVADELPRELIRLIEFLNQQFRYIEVLGVELRQYVGRDLRVLVPRVIGQTVSVREAKERSSSTLRAGGTATTMNRETFMAACQPETHRFMSAVLDKAVMLGYNIKWSESGFGLQLQLGDRLQSIIYGTRPNSAAAKSPTPALEAYVKPLESPDSRKWPADLFEAIPGFQRVLGGKQLTIRCVLKLDAIPDPQLVLKAMEACARELPALEEGKSPL